MTDDSVSDSCQIRLPVIFVFLAGSMIVLASAFLRFLSRSLSVLGRKFLFYGFFKSKFECHLMQCEAFDVLMKYFRYTFNPMGINNAKYGFKKVFCSEWNLLIFVKYWLVN